MVRRTLRTLTALVSVAMLTFVAYRVISVNAATVGFLYLLLVLVVASAWGIVEASLASVGSTLAYNFFFLPPIGTFTIADPDNWVALSSFLTTALIASRLSAKAKRRALEAVDRQHDLERLYTFSRAILLIDGGEPFPKQLNRKLAEIFELTAAVLYDRRTGEFYRAGPADFEGMDDQLRESALCGASFSDPKRNRIITAVRLGSEPIGSLALQGAPIVDSALQGVANLVAIGLERARAQDLAHQVEAAKQSEHLRTTLIDAMAHEFKTPLTSIKAATTSLLALPSQPLESRTELLTIADEETEHLRRLVDDAVELARLDISRIDIQPERANMGAIVREVVGSMQNEIEDRPFEVVSGDSTSVAAVDRRLIKLAIKQLVDNALKYSQPGTPVAIRTGSGGGVVTLEITNHGKEIPVQEQARIFERFYRSPSVQRRIPGSGLGLSIAHSIVRAHHGDLTVASRPGETTFRLILPGEGA